MGNNGFDSLTRLHTTAIKHGTDEQRERLLRMTGGGTPSTAYRPLENSLYLAESTAVLFEALFREVGELRQMLQAMTELQNDEKSS